MGMNHMTNMLYENVAIYLGVAIGLLAALALLLCLKRTACFQALMKILTLQNMIKIVFGFFLIATKIPAVYDVEMPREVNALLGVFSLVVSFGVEGIGSVLTCAGMGGYLSMLILYMLTPAILALLIFCQPVLNLFIAIFIGGR